ncbi:MAG: cytochrome c3 family protein [Pseudomonadota bacterium]
MTKKRTIIIWAAVIALVVLGPPRLIFSEDGSVVFNLEAFPRQERPTAAFDHDAHMDYPKIDQNCYICHHLYEDGKLVEGKSSDDRSCVECHDPEAARDGAPRLLMAYHHACQGCHEKERQGPLACGECHKK